MLNLYFPKVKLSRKKAKDKDWITLGIKRSITQRNKLFHIQLKDTTIRENVDKWKKYRNMLDKIIKNAQKDYYKNLIKQNNNNCIVLWKTLRNIISIKQNKQPSIT